MIAYAQLNTAGLTTHTGIKPTPYLIKGSYQDGYQTARSLAPTALFTGGKIFLPYASFLGAFFYLCGIDAVTQPALPPKTPQNRAKSASRRAKTAKNGGISASKYCKKLYKTTLLLLN